MRRVCYGCVNSNNRKKSSTDPDAGTDCVFEAPLSGGTGNGGGEAGGRTKEESSWQFGDLEGIAERCSMAGVSYHLRRAKLAWMSEAGSKKTKQTCMADFV